MHVEFEGADGVGDVFDGIALAVGEIVHGVDAPLVSRAVMAGVLDAIEDGIPEEHVGMGHVYLGAQHLGSVRILPVPHFAEETEVLFDAAVSPGTLGAGGFHRAAALADFLLGLVVHIGEAFVDELFGPFIQLVEIVGGIEFLVPLETEPLDVFLYGVHIFRVLLGGIRVVIAEVGLASVFLGESEIEADALGVAKMQVAVGLRRETGHDAVHLSGGEVGLYYFFEEILAARLNRILVFKFRHFIPINSQK